ncbi:MAG: hypothetical protein J6R08_07470 [Opitutales bacterium]|nr:hypothetical protein [Opitutales bacterium]
MDNGDIQKTPSDKTPDIVELDAVEINTPRPNANDVFEDSPRSRTANNARRTPPFVYAHTQNGCNNCCLGVLILFILFVLALF